MKAFDSLILRSVSAQLKETIIGGEVIEVIQSSPSQFILKIYSHGNSYNLLFSIHPVYARVHITPDTPERGKRWHFADFLQAHIGRGTVQAVEQIDFDRIIMVRIVPKRELTEPMPKILIGEFMGKHSNVILVEEETSKILESMKHIDESMSRYRQVLPGRTYIMPPINQEFDLFSADSEVFSRVFIPNDEPIWRRLLKNFRGMSPLLAKEIVARAKAMKSSPEFDISSESLQEAILQIRDDILNARYLPNVVVNAQGDVVAVSAIELRQFFDSYPELRSISFPTISDALEHFYQHLIAKESFSAEKSAILQAVKRKYQSACVRHELLSQQLRMAEDADNLKLKGELLIANLGRIKRGQKEVTLPNFYDPSGPEVTIQLDKRLSPSDNAQKYFESYKKAKRSKEVLAKLIAKNDAELEYLRRIIEEIERSNDMPTLANVSAILCRKGIIKGKITTESGLSKEPDSEGMRGLAHMGVQKKEEERQPFRRFRSSDDFQIYVGRNDKENELLIREYAGKNDMWLHAKQIEGSHVIISNPQRRPDIPKRTLLEAAIIAAYFSKAKSSSVVPVDYTWIKYVNKPRGAKPGFVTYRYEKTLFVSPSDFDSILKSSSESDISAQNF